MVAPRRVFAAALMLAGADQAFDVSLHQKLECGPGNDAKEIATVLLGQKFRKVHVGLGHRGLRVVRGRSCKLHPTIHLDGHPGTTPATARKLHHVLGH